MESSRPVTVRDLREDHRKHAKAQEDKKESWGYYVVRPLSFYPTALFLRLGISANQATWISVFFLCIGLGMLSAGPYWSVLLGATLVNVWLVLDFIDGNIARYQQTSSAYGEFIDALGAFLAYFLFFAAGIGAYRNPDLLLVSRYPSGATALDPAAFLVLGSWASLTAVWIRLVYQKFKNTFPKKEFQRYEVLETRERASTVGSILQAGNNLIDLSGLLLPFLLLSAALRVMDVFLVVMALANTLVLAVSLAKILRSAGRDPESP